MLNPRQPDYVPLAIALAVLVGAVAIYREPRLAQALWDAAHGGPAEKPPPKREGNVIYLPAPRGAG